MPAGGGGGMGPCPVRPRLREAGAETVGEPRGAPAYAVPAAPQEAWACCCLPLGRFALSSLSGIRGQFTLPLRLFILFHT